MYVHLEYIAPRFYKLRLKPIKKDHLKIKMIDQKRKFILCNLQRLFSAQERNNFV